MGLGRVHHEGSAALSGGGANVALIYNWWNLFVRCADPHQPREAITSRPLLLCAVGRMTRHARVTKLVSALTHEAAFRIKAPTSPCLRRPEPHSLSRAAVGQNPAMAGHAALHRGRNARPPGAARLTTGCHADGLTEENRIKYTIRASLWAVVVLAARGLSIRPTAGHRTRRARSRCATGSSPPSSAPVAPGWLIAWSWPTAPCRR